MEKIKYTTDGKKVAVIGKLNAQETIVQEIFISGEAEIPSGENFVVKSLHNTPVVSWKENEIKKIENNYNEAKRKFSELEQKLSTERKKLNLLLEDVMQSIKSVPHNDIFIRIKELLTGEINFVVIDHYSGFEIVDLNDVLYKTDHWSNVDDKLKLLTLFGSKTPKFEWRLNDYSDGSGSNKEVYPCKNKKEGMEIVKNICMAYIEKYNAVSERIIKASIDFNFHISEVLISDFYQKQIEAKNKTISSLKEKINKEKEDLKGLKSKI